MARDVEFNITANDRTGPGIASAARGLKGLDDHVKQTTRSIGAEGARAGSLFSSGILAGVRSITPTGGAALAGMAVIASPTIAATLSAAVLGGAAGGGILGGIALASRDARVAEAGKLLGERLLGGLEQDSSPILAPLLDAMALVYARAEDFDRIMSRVFDGVSDDIVPLTSALLDAAEAIGEGFADAVEGSGPVITELGTSVVRIADQIGEGLTELSDNGVSAAAAIEDVTTAVVTLTDATFEVVDALSEAYVYMELFTPFTAVLNLLGGESEEAAAGVDNLGEGLRFTAAEAEDAGEAVQKLNDEVFRAAGLAISAAEAQLRYQESVKSARDAVDGLTRVSAEEESQLLRQATAANTLVESLTRTGASSDEVAAASVRARSEFIGTATAMGVTRARAEELANKYLGIPTVVNTRVNMNSASAEAELDRIKAKLGDIPSLINVAIRVTETTASRSAVAAALNKQNFSADAQRFVERSRHAELAFMASEATLVRPAPAAPVARVGGPEPLSVENSVTVALDGRPFYDMTIEAVSSAQSRTSFWQRVGTR